MGVEASREGVCCVRCRAAAGDENGFAPSVDAMTESDGEVLASQVVVDLARTRSNTLSAREGSQRTKDVRCVSQYCGGISSGQKDEVVGV